MARTDVQDAIQHAGSVLSDNTRDLAASTAETVSSAIETAAKRGRKARKKARKKASKAAERARLRAQAAAAAAQRDPKGHRGRAVLGGLVLAGIAAATVRSRRTKAQSPGSSEFPSDGFGDQQRVH